MNMESQKSCKIIILGDSSVGKTTLIHNFINEEYRADFKATLGMDLSTGFVTVDDQQVQIDIWDTAGTERFLSIGQQFYRGTDACILVADLTNHETLVHLRMWRDGIVDAIEMGDPLMFPFVIFANKADLSENRKVSSEELREFGKMYNCPVFEVSAKTGENVEEGFITVVRRFLEQSRVVPMRLVVGATLERNDRGGGCC